MSYIFSRALVEASSPANSLGTAASAQLSLSHMPKPCLLHDKTMEPSRLSRFGMTCAPLTESHGGELLTSWLEGFRARTLVRQEPVPASTGTEAASGAKWHGLFARYSRDTSSWRTPQCSLLGDLDEFSETWPRWGSMRSGESFLRQIPELRISGSASGLWPTPNAMPASNDLNFRCSGDGRTKPNKLGWAVADSIWPTPVASDTGHRKARYAQGGSALSLRAGGHLNPEWVEWLMGWPIGWTGLGRLETARYQEWLQQHGIYSANKEAA